MSCGTKLEGAHHGFSERYEISEKLESEGEYSLALKVRHGDCLDSYDLRRAESALDRQGLNRNWDYREENCQCLTEDEDK